MRTDAPWRDLPPEYGDCENTHRRFSRWRGKWIGGKLLEQLVDDVDSEWLMVDASHIKAPPDAAGKVGENKDMSVTKGRGHLAVDAFGLRLRLIITAGKTRNDKELYKAQHLIENAFLHLKR